jgi:hypothetical protein
MFSDKIHFMILIYEFVLSTVTGKNKKSVKKSYVIYQLGLTFYF